MENPTSYVDYLVQQYIAAEQAEADKRGPGSNAHLDLAMTKTVLDAFVKFCNEHQHKCPVVGTTTVGQGMGVRIQVAEGTIEVPFQCQAPGAVQRGGDYSLAVQSISRPGLGGASGDHPITGGR